MHRNTCIFVAGAALGIAFGFLSPRASEIAVAALLCALLQSTLLFRKEKSYVSVAAILLCCGIALGIVRVQFVSEKIPYVCEEGCRVDAVIVTSPLQKDEYQKFVVHVDDEHDDVLVRAPLYPLYALGDEITITGKIEKPPTIYPHGEEKGFDYVSYLQTKSIGSESYYPKVEVASSDVATLSVYLGRLKNNLVERIEHVLPQPSASLASGMLFGDDQMSKELTDTFRVAGLSHIVVLSGFNIAIVIATVLYVFQFLPYLVRVISAGIVTVLFVMMVGAEASVVRATCMAFIGLVASVAGREYVAKQALVVSLFLIVMYEPFALLHDASLHLSFLATAGLIYFHDTIYGYISKYISHGMLTEIMTTTFAAYLTTLPYSMYAFGHVSLYALLANIFVLPFVPLTMLLSLCVVVLSFVSDMFARLIGYLDTTILSAMIGAARGVDHLPLAYLTVSISFVWMCLLYLVIVLGNFYLAQRRERSETNEKFEEGKLSEAISY